MKKQLAPLVVGAGGIPQYGDKLDLVDFKVYKRNAKTILKSIGRKAIVNIQGYISLQKQYVEEESGFGDPFFLRLLLVNYYY